MERVNKRIIFSSAEECLNQMSERKLNNNVKETIEVRNMGRLPVLLSIKDGCSTNN